MVVITLTLLLWSIAAMIRRHYGKPLTRDPRARRMRLILRIVCLLDVLFVVGFAILLSLLEKPGAIGSHADFWMHLVQMFGVLGGIGALYAIFVAAVGWGDKQQWVWYRLWNVLRGSACLGCFWFAFHWSLLNFNLHY